MTGKLRYMLPAVPFDVRRLRVLRAVAEHGTFAAAAAALDYTPSAISQQIAALEREAGLCLVERGARGARLTEAGWALDRHAQAVLGQLAAARRELDELQSLTRGTVRLAAFESAWTALVPAAVAAFREAHPDVEIDLAQADLADALAAVRSGERDVALVFEPNGLPADALAGLTRTELCDDPLRVVLPAGHRLAGRRRVELAELAGEPWVQPTMACAGLVNRACALAGFVPRVVFSSPDYGAIQGFVGAGAGVALVPELAVLAGNGRVVARPLAGDSPPARRIAAVTGPASPAPPAVQSLIGELRAAATRLAAAPG